MKLKNIILISHLIIFVFALIICVAVFRYSSAGAFHSLEMSALQKDQYRIQRSMESKIEQLSSFASDWGIWDDLYAYVINKNDEFHDSNFSESTLKIIKTAGILITDNNFNVITAYTSEENKEMYSKLVSHIAAEKIKFYSAVYSKKNNVLLYSEALSAYFWSVIQPITNTAENAPVNGFLIFSRVIDSDFINEISKDTGVAVNLGRYSEARSSATVTTDKSTASYYFLSGSEAVIQTCIPEASGGAGLCTHVFVPRDFTTSFTNIITNAVVYLFAIALAVTVLNLYLINRLITVPCQKLSSSFVNYSKSGDLKQKFRPEGPMEMQDIAIAANIMVDEISNLHGHVENLSKIDQQTDIYNRTYFFRLFEEEVKRAGRAGYMLSLMIVDIDHFSRYNTAYGQEAGDKCLIEIASLLKSATQRPTDVVARYGGEEFAVLLTNTDIAGLRTVAEKIKKLLEEKNIPNDSSDAAPYVTVSIGGVTFFPNKDTNPMVMATAADRLMHVAKAKGRNSIVLNSFQV
jgi:diguanylate cyclase (GGDEF)-like protein